MTNPSGWNGINRRQRRRGRLHFRAEDGWLARIRIVLLWWPPLTIAVAGLLGSAGALGVNALLGETRPIRGLQRSDSLFSRRLGQIEAQVTILQANQSLAVAAINDNLAALQRRIDLVLLGLPPRRAR